MRRRKAKPPTGGASAAALGAAAAGTAAVGGAAAYGAYQAGQGPPGGAPSAPVRGPSGTSVATTAPHAASAPPGGDIEAPLIGHRLMGARPAGETVLQDEYAMGGIKSELLSSEGATTGTTTAGVAAGDSRLVRCACVDDW